jgi:hypothetical protein
VVFYNTGLFETSFKFPLKWPKFKNCKVQLIIKEDLGFYQAISLTVLTT